MSAQFWTLDRVADALASGNGVAESAHGHRYPRGPGAIAGVSTDTRACTPGDLFVALRGERFDAHDFLRDALAAGAGAVVVSRAVRVDDVGVPVYEVADTTRALGALARYRRRSWGRPVIAVAGSNGKTGTKDLLRAALASMLQVHATTGNLNNQIGVPQTLLALPDDADLAVIEMGTDHPGEIAILRAIGEPDIAIVTSIGEEHLEWLGDLDGVLREESQVFDGAAIAITPASQPEVGAAARGRARRVVSAGLDDGDVRPTRWGIGTDGLGVLDFDGTVIRPPVRGEHNLRNAMLAIATARECGVSLEDAARGIAAMPLAAMRLAWTELGPAGATLINDAYNSNPASARAAIQLLERAGPGRQRVLVLGTMRELGPQAPALHDDIARQALASSVDVIAGVGDFAAALERAGKGGSRVITATDVEDLWPRLEPVLHPDATILLKASRGVRLERLVPYLTAWATR